MSKSARSVLVFGVYLVLLGLVLIAVPNVLLGAFGLALTTEVWVRVVGMLVLCLAFYYIQAATHELTSFFQREGKALPNQPRSLTISKS